MADDTPGPKPDGTFEERLQRAKAKLDDDGRAVAPNPLSLGLRVATDLVAGVMVGALIGWWLDKWLGTKPWLLAVMLLLGFAAGTLNVLRTLAQWEKAAKEAAAAQAAEREADED